MKLAAPAAVSLLLLLAVPAMAQPSGAAMRDGRGGRVARVAQPGEVAAADIAASLLAQEDGRWKSFKKHGADGAIMFVPQRVDAKQWLKNGDEAAGAISWNPHEIWSSCDGSLAISRGVWEKPDGSKGWYTSAWERQKDGEYRWTMELGGENDSVEETPIMIRSHTPGCKIGMRGPGGPRDRDRRDDRQTLPDIGHPYAISRDETMRWDVETGDDCARHVTVRFRDDSGWSDPVLDRTTGSGQGCAN